MALASQHILFDKILDFLSSTPTPQDIVAFRPPESLQARASDLLEKNREGRLSLAEREELDELERMNHFMSMLKARARQKILNEYPIAKVTTSKYFRVCYAYY